MTFFKIGINNSILIKPENSRIVERLRIKVNNQNAPAYSFCEKSKQGHVWLTCNFDHLNPEPDTGF